MDHRPKSVRPSTSEFTTTMSSGLDGGVAVDSVGGDNGAVVCVESGADVMAGVFPVGEFDGENNMHECQAAEEEEQALCPPCLSSPYQPTCREYLDHCVTHFPFRAWCPYCVRGRGRSAKHVRQDIFFNRF